MKTHQDLYSKEATSLLRDITMYHALTKEQIFSLYPGKQKIIEYLLTYLVKQYRIKQESGFYLGMTEDIAVLDQGLLAAVWVLIDFIDQVDFHSVSDFPTEIIFFMKDEVYEIIYAASGKEALINTLLSHQSEAPSNYIIMVDHEEQIPLLNIPNVVAYCTVSPSGEVQYYQQE